MKRFTPSFFLDKEFERIIKIVENNPHKYIWGNRDGYGLFYRPTMEKIFFTTDWIKASRAYKDIKDYGIYIEKDRYLPF